MRFPRPLIVLFVLAGLLLIGFTGFSALLYYKIRDVKGPLLNTLQQYIDGELKIDEAEVVFVPAGINLKGVRLYAKGDPEPAAEIPEAKLRFNLIPLIQKKIETRLTLKAPVIRLKSPKRGPSNMERIFAPVMAQEKHRAKSLDELWWRRLAIEDLDIEKAHVLSSQEGGGDVTELKNIDIQAKKIRFESSFRPAEIRIRYELPRVAVEPMELKTKMRFKEKEQAMELQDGAVRWGPIKIDLEGVARLPSDKNKDVQMDIAFGAKKIHLKDLKKVLRDAPDLEGEVALQGKVQGSPFAPVLALTLDSSEIRAHGRTLENFHGEISKKTENVSLDNCSFDIFGGKVAAKGSFLPKKKTSADVSLSLNSLSLAAMSGKKDLPARLSGNLKLKSPDVTNTKAFSGGGPITVGPIPLPQADLRNKIRLAEILAAGTGLNQMVNVGMLSNSRNIIGTQVDQLKATVSIAGGNLSLHPFSLGNGHFSASGNGQIIQEKSINAAGTFTLSQGVTRQLITDPLLRRTMTDGSDRLSFPFSLSGPLADPQVSVDSSALKGKAAMATALIMQRQIMGGGINPNAMINNALGQALGGQQPTRTQNQTTRQPSRTQGQKTPSTGNSIADQLLFGR